MKYKRIAAGVLAAAALLIAALPPASADTPVPQAVSVDASAEKAVLLDSRLSLREEGETHKKYLNGNDFGMFEPSKALTRAEAAQIFYILLDEPPETGGSFRSTRIPRLPVQNALRLLLISYRRAASRSCFMTCSRITHIILISVLRQQTGSSALRIPFFARMTR